MSNLWCNRTAEVKLGLFRARLVPMDKSLPNIPKEILGR